MAGGFMLFQFSFIATAAALIVVGRALEPPMRVATLPKRHW
jgi:hypothetical protein